MLKMYYSLAIAISIIIQSYTVFAQQVNGFVQDSKGQPIANATVSIESTKNSTKTDEDGKFVITFDKEKTKITIRSIGFLPTTKEIDKATYQNGTIFKLEADDRSLDEVVVSGTLKAVSKLESPIPVEVYSSKFFKTNPAPTIFESLQNINGVRPQINCSVCNTGDIHINGLEGPYTMVLIDGMPIVSGLSTVYGLNGIPQSLIERVEIVKGPASTLYGSEAVGGLINVITKNPNHAPLLSIDAFGTSWQEYNLDLGGKFKVGSAASLLGVNYFNYSNPMDKNKDNFTDVALSNRLSLFNKWNFARKDNKLFSIAGRYVHEDRWGGEMQWNKGYRGGDEVYGESIYTRRWEFMGIYDIPGNENLSLSVSANGHNQNSAYGTTLFLADQRIFFSQLTWNKAIGNHDILAGLAYRYTYYKDNTPATIQASRIHLPGFFLQDEIALNDQHKLLIGARYDYNSIHGSIVSPRINYKWNSKDKSEVIRVGIGNGYRVANIFTEDHAALTGARRVVFAEDLQPETSWNANINYVKKFYSNDGSVFSVDASAFYTYFMNKIIPDYETNVKEIIYANLDGHAISKGISVNLDWAHRSGLKAMIGATLMDVYSVEDGVKEWQMLTERFMGTWTIGYNIRSIGLNIDYTGNVIGPMRLPILGENDPRPEKSKAWSIQNIQLTKTINPKFEIYGGIKNLLNWTPAKGLPFLISRAHDPFEKIDDPSLLPFDPNYVYAPNQGIRGFLGLRYNIN